MASPPLLHGLLYRSQAVGRLTADDIATLAIRASRNNALVGVTGALLHAEPVGGAPGLFVQWLEGAEDDVRAMYGRISEDDRHVHSEVIAEGPIVELVGRDDRLFGDWNMRLVRLGTLPVTLESFLNVWLSLHRSETA